MSGGWTPELQLFLSGGEQGGLASLREVISLQGQAALKLPRKPAHWHAWILSDLSRSRLEVFLHVLSDPYRRIRACW